MTPTERIRHARTLLSEVDRLVDPYDLTATQFEFLDTMRRAETRRLTHEEKASMVAASSNPTWPTKLRERGFMEGWQLTPSGQEGINTITGIMRDALLAVDRIEHGELMIRDYRALGTIHYDPVKYINRLERKGYMERVGPHPQTGRSTLVAVTPDGQEVHSACTLILERAVRDEELVAA